ncbi:DUF2971 domain-containing protein [Inquilinus sp. CA228]|uniref:DUF2971 domain-containing protein n=1 Tax=Inquilinus sp. CA228 TaxID=3455609 RepID=UPI003F8D4D1D
MNNDDLWAKLGSVAYDVPGGADFFIKRPLLAHYTTISSLEKILSGDELWFSNPLFMNDLEEVKYGIIEGTKLCRESDALKRAFDNASVYNKFLDSLDHYFAEFHTKHAFDIYVFSLSEHSKTNNDGLLSMWRGYGANGNGAALIFDASNMTEIEHSPLKLSKVIYGTGNSRLRWSKKAIPIFAKIISECQITEDQAYVAAYAIFYHIKIFALYTKHSGFKEEREWRITYFNEMDAENKLTNMLSYHIGNRGVEPKLKLKLAPMEGIIAPEATIDNLVRKIILGPTISSALSIRSIKRMLESIGKTHLCDRVVASQIPFRAT